MLFERFELYASLANGTVTTTKIGLSQEQRASADITKPVFPSGGQDGTIKPSALLFSELGTRRYSAQLEAGFAPRVNKEFLEMDRGEPDPARGRMQWGISLSPLKHTPARQ